MIIFKPNEKPVYPIEKTVCIILIYKLLFRQAGNNRLRSLQSRAHSYK